MAVHQHKLLLLLCLTMIMKTGSSFRCDRRPYGSTTQSSTPDGRFKLTVTGTDNTYLPDQVYTIQLAATDGESLFTSFMVSAEGDMKPDPRNPRRLVSLNPGELRADSQSTGRYSDRCLYSVEQSSNTLKESVEIFWQAPPSGSGCVTLRAMVAENQEVWFVDGAPLTKKMCEDMRQPDDVSPIIMEDCQVCDEAKYEIAFTGIWSRNIHPRLYPESDWIPRYSDMVGASHAVDYILWAPGSMASEGLKDLAEHTNSSQFEAEIREKIGDGVRTLIKGKGHGYKKMGNPTYSFFRADKVNHLVTIVVALHPSPDWFLGVTRFELCQADNTWLQERELNLFPWDAGTDSGVSYESANVETFPQDAINRVQMSSYDQNSPFYETDIKDLHPFGTLSIKLIRTYHRECEETPDEGGESNPDEGDDKEPEPGGEEPEEPSRYQNPDLDSGHERSETPIETDPESPEDCPMTQWLDWSECIGPCVEGKIEGFKWRERYHLVNGVAVEKYDPGAKHSKEAVPEECKSQYDDVEQMPCEDECSEQPEDDKTNINAERRRTFVSPGHPWNSKKRDIFNNRNFLKTRL